MSDIASPDSFINPSALCGYTYVRDVGDTGITEQSTGQTLDCKIIFEPRKSIIIPTNDMPTFPPSVLIFKRGGGGGRRRRRRRKNP